jgi:hypothetical protein
MENTELLKALRELQGGVNEINQRGAGACPIPSELQPGAAVDPATRAKALDAYTTKLSDALQPTQFSKDQRALYEEQIRSVLATL